METLILRDQDERVDGEGLRWWLFLDASSGTPYVDGLPLEKAAIRGWWELPYGFDRETTEVELVVYQGRRVVAYERTRAVEGYPERLTPEEYHARTDEDEGEYDAFARVLYEPQYEDVPPAVTPLDLSGTRVIDGAPPPQDGLSWKAALPNALRDREEYAHLFPGNLSGFREAVAAALDALPDVSAYASSGKPHVSVFLHVKLPRLERLEWQRKPFYPGMTKRERRKASERLMQTHEVVTRSLEIPVVAQVGGANRAEATQRWHEGIAELVEYVKSISGNICPTCNGRGFLEGESDDHRDG